MKQLLTTCTTESPFRSPDTKMYYQVNGVAMGSPLGTTFAEYIFMYVTGFIVVFYLEKFSEDDMPDEIAVPIPCFIQM